MTSNKEATAKGKKEAPSTNNSGREIHKDRTVAAQSLSRTDNRFPMANPEELVKSPEGFSEVEVGNDSYTPDRDKNKLIKTTHSDKGESHRLVGGYIKAIREIVNEEGEDPHLLVEFKTIDGELKTAIFSRTQIAFSGTEVARTLVKSGYSLAKIGSNNGYGAQNDLVNYLNASRPKRAKGSSKVGWIKDGKAFLLPNGREVEAIGSKEEIPFIGDREGFPQYTRRGTLEGWLKEIKDPVQNSKVLTAVIGIALAPSLLKFTTVENGVFLLYGGSGLGKTTAGRIGLSVWGTPNEDEGADICNLRATLNGVEGYFRNHNGFFTYFDELGEFERPDQISGLSYLFGNGYKKGRMNADQTIEKREKIRHLGLMTGEYPLEHFSNKPLAEGADQRITSIPIPTRRDSEGFQTGIFDILPLESQYRKEALELTRSNQKMEKTSPYELLASPLGHLENYGTLGVEFIKALVSMLNNEVEPQDLRKDIEKHYRQWANCLISNSASHCRVGKRLALASYAGELAIEEGLFSYTDEDGKRVDVLTQGAFINATQALYKAWAGVFMTEEEKIKEALNELIGALLSQKSHFMHYIDKGAKHYERQEVNSYEPLFGAIVTLGYGNNEGDKTLFIISQAEIKKLCLGTTGRKFEQLIREAKRLGRLITNDRHYMNFRQSNTPFKELEQRVFICLPIQYP